MRAEPIDQPHAFHAEGPVWWRDWGGLRYLDMMAGDVLTVRDDGVERVHVGSVAAAVRPRGSGGAIVALERSFALTATDDLSDLAPQDPIWRSDVIRFNDGGCDPTGAFWCGSMAYDQTTGAASLYRLDPQSGAVTVALRDLTVSNGIGWSPDGSTAYFNDTPTRVIWAFDRSASSGLTNRRPFVTLGEDNPGSADGLWVDQEGGVWTAMYGGSAVRRFDFAGALSEVVELPVTNVTACTFGGDGLKTLYITTTRENVPDGEQPLAGAVFACTPGVGGLPVIPYAG